MPLLNTNKFYKGVTNFRDFVPVTESHLAISDIKLREKAKQNFGSYGTFYPLSIKSSQLAWKGSPKEKAIESSIWFHDKQFYPLLLKELKDGYHLNIHVDASTYKDLAFLESVISRIMKSHTLKSCLSSDTFLATKLKKNVSVFEVMTNGDARPSSLDAMTKCPGEVLIRPLIHITGLFTLSPSNEVKLCSSIEQIGWMKAKRQGRKRVREAEIIPHYAEADWKERINAFAESWLQGKADELSCFIFVENDEEAYRMDLDDIDVIVTPSFRKKMLAITDGLFHTPDLPTFHTSAMTVLEAEEERWQREYQTQPEDWRLMRQREMILRFHRDLLEFIKPIVLALRLQRVMGVKALKTDTLMKEAVELHREYESVEKEYVGEHHFKRLMFANAMLGQMIELARTQKKLVDRMEVLNAISYQEDESLLPLAEILGDLFDRQHEFEVAQTRINSLMQGPSEKKAKHYYAAWLASSGLWADSFSGKSYGIYDPRHRPALRRIMHTMGNALFELTKGANAEEEASQFLGKTQNKLELIFAKYPASKSDYALPLRD